jgi:catechol 2,3-dioxygenase-like lactoylglutathione lyase family enzyme
MTLAIRELNHVMLRVTDLAASEQFYGEILGLSRLPRPAFDFPGAWFALGRQELHLVADPKPPVGPRGHHHFAIWVEDHAAAHADLKRKGWPHLRGPQLRPDGVNQLFVTDPDGYVIELMSAPTRSGGV